MKLSVFALMLSLAALAQPPEGQRPEGSRPEGDRPRGQRPAPKNLKILAPENVMPTMQAFRTALGVQCNFCHVQGDFASDEKKTKEVARNMLVMTKSINANFPDGKYHVTCYTCHRGAEMPLTAPAAAEKGAAEKTGQ